ncbi:BSD domain-containing protein [Euphorbia peplus]|nr:BSD domain-containing protein [Euphorbia peplus]
MEDIWKRAKQYAEEAAKKSQTLTSSNRISDLVAETAKKSKELALEASKKADQFKIAALKQADQIQLKSISDIIPSQLSSLAIVSSSDSSTASDPDELLKFGVTDDLRDFVKGLTSTTFSNFPIQDEADASDVLATGSNVRKDLNDWQERHATLVLTNVKQISKLRYELCPRAMKERRFWRIYFTLVSTHVATYEKKYMEDIKRKSEEQKKDDKSNQSPVSGENSESQTKETSLKSKTSSAEQDLDSFLLGDLEDSDGDAGDAEGDGSFDDDFDKIDNSDIEDEKHSKKASVSTG